MKNNQKIPEGWSVKKLSDVSTFCGGSTPSRDHPEYFNGNIPWIKTTDLNNSVLYKTEENITSLGLNNSSCKIIKSGAVCVAMYGGFNQIGRTCLLGIDATINQALTAIIPNEKLLNFYLLLYLNNNVRAWKSYAGSSRKDPNITKKDIESFKIIVPPLAEQEKIAEILGTWDEAIEKLSSLIEQKKLLKKGLMQKLLTGKTRLSTFTQPWKEVKLGAVLEAISRRNKNLNISRVLSVTNSRGFILPEEQFSRGVASEDLSNYKVVKNGEFAYNPSRLNVGSIDRLDNFTDGVLSPMYVIFKCNEKLSSNYMKHWITTTEFNTKVRNSAQGSVRETVDFKTLSSIKINLPSDISEQQAIADVLSTADDEIDLLNKKLILFKEQKKGLMQQLLTGQVRVKVN